MDHMMKLKLDSAIHNGLTLHHSLLTGLSVVWKKYVSNKINLTLCISGTLHKFHINL